MKNKLWSPTQQNLLRTVLGVLFLFVSGVSIAQITPLADSYTYSTDPNANYGSGVILEVDGASFTSYIQFPLSSVPSGASVSAATLKLYVNTVTTAGTFNVDYVNGTWSEGTLTYGTAPALGTTIASGISITAADKNQYILINVTSAVQAWLSGEQTNDGIALVADGKFNATFDSKENTTTSHPPELDIAYGDGAITGITTASGGGLIGGGTSGALNLSLTNTCASGQVLRWNGSAWACSSAGMGTITGITAGTDLTGGGTSGKVTLNLNTSALNSAYARLSAANTFTGNQTVNGNLSATGVVTGSSYQIGGNLFAFGSALNGNAFLGFAGNTTTTGATDTAIGAAAFALNTTGAANTAAGYAALNSNTTGGSDTAVGTYALVANTTGQNNTATGAAALANNTTGGNNTATGYFALYENTTGSPNNAFGYQTLYSNTTGADNDAFGYQALVFNSGGYDNDAFGYQTLYSNTVGFYNNAFGYQALNSNTSGFGNVAVGSYALQSNTTGEYNSAIGYAALANSTTGSGLTCIGLDCTASADGLTNATAIGAHAVVGQSNSLVLGGTGQYAVKVGIGTTQPTNILTIGRGLGHPVSDSWETYSSRRWKTNIKTLPDALSKVEQLRGVSYDRKDSGKHEIGVIAEEVGQVVPEVVSYESNGKDAAGVDYSRLTALLIEAVKQQQSLIAAQKKQIAMQRRLTKAQQQQISSLQLRMTTQQNGMALLTSKVSTLESGLPRTHETTLAQKMPITSHGSN
jgi:hypothetical protein